MKKLEVLLTALCLFIGLGAMFGSFALADALEQEVNPATLLEGKTVIDVGTCDIEGKEELSYINGRFICAFFAVDDDTMYLGLFGEDKALIYLLEFKRDGSTRLLWEDKNCTGECA